MDRHGKDGHLNVVTLDQDSVVTGFGKHARVVAFLPDREGLYARVDLPAHVRKYDPTYPDLPEPTIAQILRVARVDQCIRGRWKIRSRELYDEGTRVEYHFDKA